MKIVYMGTPRFAVPVLEALAGSGHTVTGVVTRPDRPGGRGQATRAPEVKTAALGLGLPVLQPEKLTDAGFLEQLTAWQPDMIVVVAFRILPAEVLRIPPRGCINLHGSLLPAYRGAAPIQWAVANGEKNTGLTTFFIDGKVDTGNILLQKEVTIGPEETAGELAERMMAQGSALVLETLSKLENRELVPRQQRHLEGSRAPKLRKEDGLIDWTCPAETVFNRIRGFSPVPGCFTLLDGKNIRIHRAFPGDPAGNGIAPGTVVKTDKEAITVACGAGTLRLVRVQAPGKKAMDAPDFLRGNPLPEGTKFGS